MEFDLQNLIASVGFPITLSIYLLVRIEGKLQTLSDSINELSKNIIRINDVDCTCNDCGRDYMVITHE